MASKIMFDRKWKIVLKTDTRTKTLRELKVLFNIKNTLLGDPSLASFQIFNISKDTISILTDPSCTISFHAGYYTDDEKEWNVLFIGEVTNSYEIRQDVDIVWNVWARAAYSVLNVTEPNITAIENPISRKDIIDKLVASAIGIEGTPRYINRCDIKLLSLPLEDEYSPQGTYKEEFDDLLLSVGLGWQVQNSEFIVYDQENLDPSPLETDIIEINRRTGLLDVPVVDYVGVKFKSLLNGNLKPTKIINIEPNTVKYNLGNEFYVQRVSQGEWQAKGRFRIYEVTHRGDTRGDSWDSDVTAFYRRN